MSKDEGVAQEQICEGGRITTVKLTVEVCVNRQKKQKNKNKDEDVRNYLRFKAESDFFTNNQSSRYAFKVTSRSSSMPPDIWRAKAVLVQGPREMIAVINRVSGTDGLMSSPSVDTLDTLDIDVTINGSPGSSASGSLNVLLVTLDAIGDL